MSSVSSADPSDTLSDTLLVRYLAGQATPHERAVVDAWLARESEHERALDELRQVWSVTPLAVPESDPQRAWARAQTRMSSAQSQARRSILSLPVLNRRSVPQGRNVAYVVVSLVVAGILTVIALGGERWNGASSSLAVRTYATTAGQHATVTLSNGSQAQLGPSTTLSVTTDLAGRRVDARLRGEAVFTVAHHPHTSFRVYTANAVTHVLGTTFLVRRYPGDRVTQVVVANGRVSLVGMRSRPRSVSPVLTARMLGTIDDSGRVSVTPNISVDDYTSWTTGVLVFRNTAARDVIAELSRAYKVEMRIADSAIAERHLNWTVPVTQRSLANVLELLSDILDSHPVRMGRIITFVPGRLAVRRSLDIPSSSTPDGQYGK